MNSLIATVRQQFPGDTRTDEELTYFYGEWARANKPDLFEQFPDFAAQYREITRDLRPGLGTELKRSIGSAVDNLQATGYGAGALAAGLVGADKLKESLLARAREQAAEASAYTPSVGSYRDIETPGDAAYYTLGYGLGQVIPSAAESATFALVGGGVGGIAARGAAKEAVKRAVRTGAQAGLAAASIPQAAGEIYNETAGHDGAEAVSLVAGTFAGLLDLLPETYILGKFFRPGTAVTDAQRSAVMRYVRALGTEAVKTMPMEGSTEAAQEFINMAAAKYVKGEPPTVTDEDVERLINAGLIGSIGGAVFAPISAAGSMRRAPTQEEAPVASPQQTQAPAAPSIIDDTPFDLSGSSVAPEVVAAPPPAGQVPTSPFDDGAPPPVSDGRFDDTFAPISEEIPAELDYIARVQQAVAAAAQATAQAEQEEYVQGQLLARRMSGADAMPVAGVRDPFAGLNDAMPVTDEPTPFDIFRRDSTPLQSAGVAPDELSFFAARPSDETVTAPPMPSARPALATPGVPSTPSVVEPPLGVAAAPPISVATPEPAVPTVPVATPEQALASVAEVEDFRGNELQAQDTRIQKMLDDGRARTKSERGKAVEDKRRRAALLLDRATGNLYQRAIAWKANKLNVEFAQRRAAPGHGKGRGRAVSLDLETPEGGVALSTLLNETLPDGSPRFEVAGFVVLNPKAPRNLNLGSAATFFQAPQFAEARRVRLARQQQSDVQGEKRRGVRRKAGTVSMAETADATGQPAAEQVASVESARSPGPLAEFMEEMVERLGTGESPQSVRQRITAELTRRGAPKDQLEKLVDHVISETVAKYRDAVNTIRARGPAGYMLPPSQISGLFRSIVDSVRDHGGDVALFEQDATSQFVAVREGYGIQATDAEGRSLIAVATDSVLHPANLDSLVKLVHESAHQFIKSLPADQQRAYHQALSQLPWGQQRWLMNPLSLDLRLLANTPRDQLSPVQQAALDKLTPEDLNRLRTIPPETLLIEQGAEHLAMLGLDKGLSRGVLAQTIRFLKDLLFRIGMSLQRAFGMQPSEQRVRQYVENRFLQFINRDFAQSPQSVLDFRNWVGAPTTLAERVPVYRGLGSGDPRVMNFDPDTGLMTPRDFVADDTDSLGDWVQALLQKAERGEADLTQRVTLQSIGLTPEVGFSSQAASINYFSELYRAIFNDNDIRRVLPPAVSEANSPLAWFTQTYIGLKENQQPEARMEVLKGYVEKQKDILDGSAIAFDERSTIASLPVAREEVRDEAGRIRLVETSSAQDQALRSVLNQLYADINRVGNRIQRDTDFIRRAKERKSLSDADKLKLDQMEQDVVIRQRVLAHLRESAADLEIKTQSAVVQQFYPGAPYFVPATETSGESQVSEHKLPLDLNFTPQLEQQFLGHLKKMERWLQNRDNLKHGEFYNRVHQQWKRLSEDYTTRYTYAKSNVLTRKAWTRSMTDILRVINTPAALTAARRLTTLQSWIDRFQSDTRIEGGHWSEAFVNFAQALGRKPDEAFEEQVWDAFMRSFEQVNETDTKAKEKVAQALSEIYGIKISPANKKVWEAYLNLVNQTREAEKFERDSFEQMGLKVDDPRLQKGGQATERRLLRIGYLNGRRTASRLISSLYIRMNGAWSADSFATLTDAGAVAAMTEAQLGEALRPLFTDSVIRDFVEPLVRNNSPFISLRDQSGVASQATPFDVRMAWEKSGGNIQSFIRNLHDTAAPEGASLAQTTADVMAGFKTLFEQVKRDHEARLQAQHSGIETSPRQMMDARLADNWPPEWVSYAKYDSTSNYMFMHQAAINAAVGRGGFGPNGEFKQLMLAARQDIERLAEQAAEMRRSGMDPKDIAREMGEAQYEKALNAEEYVWLIDGFMHRAEQLTKTIGYHIGDMKTLVNLINLQATFVLQQPRSALIQTPDLVLAPLWTTKFSKVSLGMIRDGFKTAFGDIAGGLGFQGLAELARNTDMARRLNRHGVKDSDAYLTWSQKSADTDIRLRAPDRPESSVVRRFRVTNGWIAKVRDLSNVGANDARELAGMPVRTKETTAAKFRPFGLFSTVSNGLNRAFVAQNYGAMSDLALRGIEMIERGGGEALVRQLESGERRLTHRDLGYNRTWGILNDKAAFDYLADRVVSTMGENSLEQFIAGAWRRQQAAQGQPFELINSRQFQGIVTMAMSEFSLQANMVNTPLALMNSPLGRMLSTFLIWPWNAMVRSGKTFRDVRGRWAAEAALDGLTVVLMGVLPATVAASFLIDLYDEELLGKRSNMREIGASALIPGMALAQPAATLERIARYGAFGLASELVNGVLNFDDPRGGLTADNRIFVLSQFNALRTLIGNFYQQEGNVTYQSFGRPMLQFMAMNGPLQYVQLVSNQLGLENAETQVNARINAGNYLRATGRALDLDVRVMKGAQSIPTPVTPYIQQMELAATTGDTALFNEAFSRAVQEAAEEGKEDPVKYVKQAFADRHPLRRIFRTMPSQTEYRQMLGAMNDSGRESVSRAILSYNSYLARLGMKPVTGAEEKKASPLGQRPMSLAEARAAAAFASYSGAGP